ncbi:MAG TPA: hypothetical protein PLI31_03010 [Methanoregulaceae archaeon]|nr:hypothetical protein [Methanoregulaceae archaeon]
MESLPEDEQVIVQGNARSDFFGKGTLTLTTRRLVFEVATGGLLSRAKETKIDRPIGAILSFGSAGRKALEVHFEGNMEPTVLYVDNPEMWEVAIRAVFILGGAA